MLDKHRHFFLRDEPLEILPWLTLVDRLELGHSSIPENTNRNGKKILHQTGLTRKFNLDGSVTEAAQAAAADVYVMFLHGAHGVLERLELNIRIHRLACDSLHDDVDGLIHIVEDLGVSSQEGDDLGSFGGEWNLKNMLVVTKLRKPARVSETHISQLNNTMADGLGLSGSFNKREIRGIHCYG